MTWTFLVPCLVLGIPLVGSLLYLGAQLRRRHRFIELATALKAKVDDFGFRLDTPFGRLTVELDEGWSDSRRRLEVRIGTGKERLRTLFRRETTIDRLGKLVRINDEAQIGDVDFDRLLYIESDVPRDALRAFLADGSTKRAIWAIFAEGYDEVCIHGRSLVAARAWGGAARVPEEGSLRTVSEALQRIAATASLYPWPVKRPFRLPTWLGALGIGLVVALYFEGCAVRGAQSHFQPIDPTIYRAAMLIAFCTFAIGTGYLFDKLRGRSESLRLIVTSAALLAAALPGLSVAALVASNGTFDRAPCQERLVRNGGHGRTTGKNAHPYVELVGLRDDELEVEIQQELPSYVKPTDFVAVETCPGAFGWEWIREVRALPQDPMPKAPEPTPSLTPSARTTAPPRRRPIHTPGRPSGSARKSSRPGQGVP